MLKFISKLFSFGKKDSEALETSVSKEVDNESASIKTENVVEEVVIEKSKEELEKIITERLSEIEMEKVEAPKKEAKPVPKKEAKSAPKKEAKPAPKKEAKPAPKKEAKPAPSPKKKNKKGKK